jgi:hypothetical protein
MNSQKAIFVPGGGVPEAIRSIRFVAKNEPASGLDSTPPVPAQQSVRLEVWEGDLYGGASKRMLTHFSTPVTQTVFAGSEMPIVLPGTSIVVNVCDAPSGWEVEFQSEFSDQQGRTVKRTLILDDYGTARETLSGTETISRTGLITGVRCADRTRTRFVPPRQSKSFFGRLAASLFSRLLGRSAGGASYR